MIPTITYDHTRVRTTEFVYDVTLNGEIVAAANTNHAGEVVGLEVAARDDLLTMAAAFAQEGREQTCNQPDNMCSVDDPCPAHVTDAAAWLAANTPIKCQKCGGIATQECPFADDPYYEYYCLSCCNGLNYRSIPIERPLLAHAARLTMMNDAIQCPICGSPTHCDCDEDYVFVLRNTPLLEQCATLLDRLLGGPVIGGGILDELRRVRAALADEGW